jgi:hypothetical protein
MRLIQSIVKLACYRFGKRIERFNELLGGDE